MNQALRSKVGKFPIDSPDYALLQKLCFQKYNYTRFRDFEPRYDGDTFANFIIRNAQTCDDMIIYCKFGPNVFKCTDLFREVLLDEGMCCVFNQMHPYFLFKGELHFDKWSYNNTNQLEYRKWLPKATAEEFLPTSGIRNWGVYGTASGIKC
uniref:Uncharacterized protein n=1 Tax=Musca domestica TaxID=7370 RepID=A0A1I8MQC6_MUSDO